MRGSASRPHPSSPSHPPGRGCAAAAALVTVCLVTVTISSYPTTGLCAAGSARPPHFSAWRLGCPLGLWPPSPVTRAYRCSILAVIHIRTQQGAAPPPRLRHRSLPRGLRLRSAPPGRLWSATALRACSLRSHSLPAPHPSRHSYCGCHPYPQHRPLRVPRRSPSVGGCRCSGYRTPLRGTRADPAREGREWRLHRSLLLGRKMETHRIPNKARVTHAQTRSTPTVAGKIEFQSLLFDGCAHIDLACTPTNEANPCATMDCGLQIGANYPGNLQIALSRPSMPFHGLDSCQFYHIPGFWYRGDIPAHVNASSAAACLAVTPCRWQRDRIASMYRHDGRGAMPV